MRKLILLIIDAALVGITPLAALFIRDNLELNPERLDLIKNYTFISIPVAAAVFSFLGVHRGVWRYASLTDLLRVVAASAITILLALFLTFSVHRLDELPRSIPIIQGLLLVAALCGLRVMLRLAREWRLRRSTARQQSGLKLKTDTQYALIVGLNRLTELYLEAIAEFGGGISVVGVLADGADIQGREIRHCEIVGRPEELLQIVAQFETHGVIVERIVVAARPSWLSEKLREQLSAAERQGITLDFLGELFEPSQDSRENVPARRFPTSVEAMPSVGGRYASIKRAVDFVGAATLLVVLLPVLALIGMAVALDVGLPVVFWQQRPGRYGKRFKVYKFRTMNNSHDAAGNRIPDEARISAVGRFLRKTRLDELPQLYNILIGEMSFVGPRPLLATEQLCVSPSRLVVRPGLTGWAQVNGGRSISVEEKAALDLWYVKKMSPQLDASILVRTLGMLIKGDSRNSEPLNLATEAHSSSGAHGGPRSISPHARPSDGKGDNSKVSIADLSAAA